MNETTYVVMCFSKLADYSKLSGLHYDQTYVVVNYMATPLRLLYHFNFRFYYMCILPLGLLTYMQHVDIYADWH